MKIMVNTFFLVFFLVSACGKEENTPEPINGPQEVEKTNATALYMHYMPWFQSKEVSGYWGSHWRMSNRNPEIIDANGRREIASHYYPLIGPYDSKDPDVIEYHLLLMKYAGIDGVLIDWYGTHNVYDYPEIFNATEALIKKVDEVGLTFAIVYEEYTAENVAKQKDISAVVAAQQDLSFLQSEYFSNSSYIKVGDNPLLLTFGPRYFKQSSQWLQILEGIEPKPVFLPLWDHSSAVGSLGHGEFAWVDFTESLTTLNSFYNKVTHLDVLIGSAFPRFHDYYEEGGLHDSYGHVESNGGETLTKTLAKATERNAEYVQLVTWNDFGEGTVIEPTLEDGFLFLDIIQNFAGVSYSTNELETIYQYYLAKKKFKNDATSSEKLAEAFRLLCSLDVENAKTVIDNLE